MSNYDKALAHMNALIERGMEFPCAAWAAAEKFNVSQKKLEQAYDAEQSLPSAERKSA